MARAYVTSVDQVTGGELLRVVGIARPLPDADPSFIEAPLSGRPCLYYDAEVAIEVVTHDKDLHTGMSKKNRQRRVLAKHRAGLELLVQGRTTSARVVLTEKTMLRVVPERWPVSTAALPPPVERFRREHHLRALPPSWGMSQELECMEARIDEGEKILVAGAASWEPDPSAGYRGGRRLVLYAAPDHQLVVSDRPDQTG